ncbi:hypothetical protein NHQ30_004985 [Ciborinia camelliae]|nr:hypothetical protein NHQ30_004985 [Ciborinia camelliae]
MSFASKAGEVAAEITLAAFQRAMQAARKGLRGDAAMTPASSKGDKAKVTNRFSSQKDLIALMSLIWPEAETVLQAHLISNPSAASWMEYIDTCDLDLTEEIEKLDPCDPRRLAALNPAILHRVVRSSRVHVRIASEFKIVSDMVMIQRSLSSSLPQADGDLISLKPLFKKVIRRTAIAERAPMAGAPSLRRWAVGVDDLRIWN